MIDDEDEDYDDTGEEDSEEESEENEVRDATVRVGGRVQIEEDGVFHAGVLESIVPAQRSRPDKWWELQGQKHTWSKHAVVKWDTGPTSTVLLDALVVEDNAMERQFRIALNKANEEMAKHLEAASKSLDKAVKISEKYGIPFDSSISFISNTYTPSTVKELHPKVDDDFINDVSGVWDENQYEYGGWRHSQAGC